MKPKLILVLIIAAISTLLFACAPSKQVFAEVSCDDFYQNNHMTKEAQVASGDSFTVTLCSNPTTGFQWSETAQISDQTVLQQLHHKFEPPKDKAVVGAPGHEVWTFKALKKGTSNVSMEYSRPWEGGEKGEWTFALTVVVK